MPCRALVLLAALLPSVSSLAQVDPHLRVDQFGYRPNARKVAVLRRAEQGFDAPQSYTPGAVVEVRQVGSNSVVWSGSPIAWQGGATHAESGDRAWLVDFSALRAPGDYYLHDVANNRSSVEFCIARDVYRGALRAALRVYFYQRSGFAKAVPFAEAAWADSASHLGTEQDLDCRSVLNPTPATSRDLSGGWYDAGDYNKYVNFADDALHPLLDAFLDAPAYWPDDYGIPESGNGIPDLLDEVRWELDWLLRMQNPDGSLLHKVSVTDFSASSPPSTDTAPRRYAPATASATASGAAVFAHAAIAFGTRPEPAMQAYAAQLDLAALAAWNWLNANPTAIPSNYNNQGFANVAAEDSAYQQGLNRLSAAAWRFVRTGDAAMRSYFDANYTNAHLFLWQWASPWESELHSALLAYSEADGCTASVAANIRQTLASSIGSAQHLGHFANGDDPYASHLNAQDYTWGSNATKCLHGIQFLLAARYGLDAANARAFNDAAEGFVHYLHGVNPLGLTYLSNVRSLGAEGSVDEMYHAWFADGTAWDNATTSTFGPAPGYLTGGPNPFFAPDPAYSGAPLVPPQNQPPAKSYLDWNASWPQNSWEVTEPAIGYQSRYVRLLAAFAVAPAPQLSVELGEISAGVATPMEIGGASANALTVLVVATAQGRAAIDLGFWSLDLGLELFPTPSDNVLAVTVANGSGRSSALLPSLPPLAAGFRLWFQASEVLDLEPAQSAVVARTIR